MHCTGVFDDDSIESEDANTRKETCELVNCTSLLLLPRCHINTTATSNNQQAADYTASFLIVTSLRNLPGYPAAVVRRLRHQDN